jgi:hypothetical protein
LAGVSGSTAQVSQTGIDVPPNGSAHGEKACPSGTIVTGGGFATNLGVIIFNTTINDNGWQNFVRNTTDIAKDLNTYAVCYSP